MPDVPSAKHGVTRPADGDFINDWPAIMRDAIDDFDALIATAIETDPRPAAGVFGRMHRAPDGALSFDTGAAWVELARAAVAQLGAVEVGMIVAYAGAALPAGGNYAWADGALIDRLDGGGQPTEFFNRVGHVYNGGVDPGSNKVRLPDKRGRVSVGADNMGQGAAGRLPNNLRARGQSSGEERHLLTAAESGTNANGATDNDGAHAHNVQNLRAVDDATDAGGFIAMTNDGGIPGTLGTGSNDSPHTHSLAARSADTAHNNLQPYEVDNYIVRIA